MAEGEVVLSVWEALCENSSVDMFFGLFIFQ